MSEAIRSIWCWIITFLDYLLDTEQATQVNQEEEEMGINNLAENFDEEDEQ